ncbi:MAG: hypothetical protein R3185_09480, partial [Candidatus Thermoplasmatota archaeon]|nr:hypothetical protein [Candidatus Thermoplasmatota archaeon]
EGEAEAVRELAQELKPAIIALCLADEVVGEARAWAQTQGSLGSEDEAYVKGLSRWGEVALPAASYGVASQAGETLGADVVGVDLGEGPYLDRYTEQISMWDLFKRSWWLRKVAKRPPEAESPEAFCKVFDARINQGPFQALEAAREEAIAEGVSSLAQEGDVLVVLPVARLAGVKRRLDRV